MKRVKLTKKIINKKFLFGLICVLFLTLLGFLITKGYSDLNKNSKIHTSNAIDMIDQRVNSLVFEINNFPRSTGQDVLFLSRLSSLVNLVNSYERVSVIKEVEKDFLEFLGENTAYYQLRYINENGEEVVRTEFDGNQRFVFSKEKLQNKKDRDYFVQTMSLNDGEVYISQLDLNIEHGEIENRGTKEKPEYVPVIRYATPVFTKNKVPKGIVAVNIYADYFLEDIRRFQREGETVLLVNNKGYYLVHPDKEKEFAFVFGKDDTLHTDYPEVSEMILLDTTGNRKVESNELIFSFKHVYPTTTSFELHKGSEKVFGQDHEENYYWTLISISERQEIEKTAKSLKESFVLFVVFTVIIVFIIVALVFMLVFKYRSGRTLMKRKKRQSIFNSLKLKR